MVVPELVVQIDAVSEVGVRLADGALDRKVFEGEPRGDPHRCADEQQEVGEVAEELDAARDGRDEEPDPDDREVPGAHRSPYARSACGEPTSTGTLARTSAITVVWARSFNLACGWRMRRWARVGAASAFTSSGTT